MDINGEPDSNTVAVEVFNNLLTALDRPSRQNINKETAALTGTLDQRDLISIFREFYPKTGEYTLFYQVHIGHSLG